MAGRVAGPGAIVAVINEQEVTMATSISWQAERVRGAAGLPEVLESAWRAFECMLAEAEANEDPATPLFPAFVLAATAAANGRDAVLLAPSLPWPPQDSPPNGEQVGGPAEPTGAVARGLALLCKVLISQLETAAGSAASSGDRDACRFAAGRARAIYDLLAGAGDD
jgi:hypothetical protein